MFEKFNEKARRALFFARYEASKLGSRVIESEHVLLGILREGEETVTELFRDLRRADHVAEPNRRQASVRIAHRLRGSCSRHGDSQSRPVLRPSPDRSRCSSTHLRILAKSRSGLRCGDTAAVMMRG